MDKGSKFDPEILQAQWLLGGLSAEELVDQAILALRRGFEGSALEQLAGLVRPTQRDLGNLPKRAFAEMGLKPIDKEQAVSLLVARGEPPTCHAITAILSEFPSFTARWKKHVTFWGGKLAGSYIDMAEFAQFVVEDLYEKQNLKETRRAFELLERLLKEGDAETKNLIGLGFFESLQSVASQRPYGNKVFEQFLGPASVRFWRY